jgi:hypothetical protein
MTESSIFDSLSALHLAMNFPMLLAFCNVQNAITPQNNFSKWSTWAAAEHEDECGFTRQVRTRTANSARMIASRGRIEF